MHRNNELNRMVSNMLSKTIVYIILIIITMNIATAIIIHQDAYTDIYYNDDGTKNTILYSGIMNYYENGLFYPIKTEIYECPNQNYEYCNQKGTYQAYFKNKLTGNTHLIKYQIDNNQWIQTTPLELYWTNGNEKQIIAYYNQEATAEITEPNNTILYQNAFGEGIHLFYTYNNEKLEKYIIIQSRNNILNTTLTGDVYMTMSEKIQISEELLIYNNGTKWNGQTIETQNSINLHYNNQSNIILAKPTMKDSNLTTKQIKYGLRKQGNINIIETKTSKQIIEESQYPIYIDPTVILNATNGGWTDDTYGRLSAPTTVFGGFTLFALSATGSTLATAARPYIQVNSTEATITQATLYLYQAVSSGAGTCNVETHNTLNNSWDEGTLTWNNQPCGTTVGSLGSCNATATDTDTDESVGWHTWDVTDIITGEGIFSIVMQDANENGGTCYQGYVSKEHATVAWWGYINLTTGSPPTDTCTYGGSGDWTINISDNCNITTENDLDGNKLYLTGDAGILTIENGGGITYKEKHFTPDDFDGDSIILIESGGYLQAKP